MRGSGNRHAGLATILAFAFLCGSDPAASQNGTVPVAIPDTPTNTPAPGGMTQIPPAAMDYKPCLRNDECDKDEYCRATNVLTWEGIPWIRGECVSCTLCQCHKQSVDGRCPDRCGTPAAEVSKMQGLFYTNGTRPTDPPGCATIIAYLFVGRRFKRSVVQVDWDTSTQFASAQRSARCGGVSVQWGDFIVSPILPAQITLRYFENTAMGFSAQSGVLSSACPDALDVQWVGRAEPERWIRASESLDRNKPSPEGIWEGKLNVFGSVCDITMHLRWLVGEANLFYWDSHVHNCDINFREIPVNIADEEEEDADTPGRRQGRWISAQADEQLEHHEGRRLLASVSADPTTAQRTDSEPGGAPVSAGVSHYDVDELRRSGGSPSYLFTSYPHISQLDFDNLEQLPLSNCSQIGKLCPTTGATCWRRSIKPEILELVQQYPATAEKNTSVETSALECVCTPGRTVVYSEPHARGRCVDVDECQLPTAVCLANSDCINTEGSFTCPCSIGFNRSSPDGPCLNVNECGQDLDSCHRFASCTDSPGSFLCSCGEGFSGNGLQCETQNDLIFEEARPVGQKINFRVFWDTKTEVDVQDVVALFKDWDRQITWMYTSQAACPTRSQCLGFQCILDCHDLTKGSLLEPRWTHEFLVPSAGPGLYTAKYYSHKLDAIISVTSILVNGSNPTIRWTVPPDSREYASGGLADCTGLFVGASCSVTVPFGGGMIVAPIEGTPAPITFSPRCGDGRMTPGNETCDDGNNVAGDGCSPDCQIEFDSVCAIVFNPELVYIEEQDIWNVVGPPDSTCIVYVCSDGSRNAQGETCDDGNLRDGDGCSSDCRVEPGYICQREDRLDNNGNIVGTNERCVPFILWLEPDQKDGCPVCHPLGDCVLWRGEKHCYCYDGYARNFTQDGEIDRPLMTVAMTDVEPHFCTDVNECVGAALDVCSSNAICTNTVGSFLCSCGGGFTGSGYGTGGFCVDNNECDRPVCAPNAICTNNEGSFTCICPTGQAGGARAQDGLCKDIDECATGAHDCGLTQICVNYGGEDYPDLSLFECTCPNGRIKFSTECFPPGFAEENLDFFERMGQDGVPVYSQGMMRFWDLDFMQTWGRFSFAEWHYVDERRLLSPTVHKSLSFVPSTLYDRAPAECPTCNPNGQFINSFEGVLSFKQGVWLNDLTCRWFFNKQGTEGVETVVLHFREFHLERDFEYFETCKIGQACQRYDEANQIPFAKITAPFELRFHSQAVDLNTPGRQNAPDPANPWKFFIVFSPQEQFNEVELDWRTPKNADQPGQTVGNFTVPEWDSSFQNNSRLQIGITNGEGLDRAIPCGFQHATASSYSVMTLEKVEHANFSSVPDRPKHRTELEGVWEGTCFPHVPAQTATCQVDLRIEENTFELSYFLCTGFSIQSLATGLITQIDEVAEDIVSLSDVHLLSYKRFSVQYTNGIPQDTESELTTANGIFLWRSDAEYAIDTIEINLHRPGQMRNPNDFPGDNDDLEIQTRPCQILYLKKIQLSNYAIPPPLATLGTVFYSAVKQQNLYTACNDSVKGLMEYLVETNCDDDLSGILGTRKNYDSGDFQAECRSGCLAPYKQRLSGALQSCVGAWGSMQREGQPPGVSDRVFHYLGGRLLFLAASQQRSDSVCVGSYRNLSCNALPNALPSVIAGACPLNTIPSTAPPEIGIFPYTRFSLVTSLQTGCVGNCLQRMETFMLLGHCCLDIMDAAQRRWWQAMTPYSSSFNLDMAAYRCMYENGPCDHSTSDVFTLQAPLQACGFTQSESWSCAYGACGLGLPATCCQPFPCRNGAWRESFGSCYCHCVDSWTGVDCGSRAVHVEGEIRFQDTNMVAFDEQTFLSTLATGMQVARSNCEMGWINVIEGQRRVGRMTDTIELGFRILVENDRDALRVAATLQVIREQGTFAIVFGGSGFGTFSDFLQAPIPRSSSGEPLCDDEVFICPDSLELLNGDTEVFVPTEESPNMTGAIVGGVIGGLVFCACCLACAITHREKIVAKLEGREEEFDQNKSTKVRKLSAKERKQKEIQERKRKEQDMGMVFGFGPAQHGHEHANEIQRANRVVNFTKFSMGQSDETKLARSNSYNTKHEGRSSAFKEALLLGSAATASNAVEQQELEPVDERIEVDPKLSLKRIASHQRMLAARLANLSGQREDKNANKLGEDVGWRRQATDPNALEAQHESVVPPAYTYPDILLPEDQFPHEQYEETLQSQAEARQRQDNVLALFERANNSSNHITPTGTPQRSVREISFLPAMTNFAPPTRPPGYLSASLVHPSDRYGNGDEAANDADSLLNNSMAPPPIPLEKFEVPVTPDKAWNSLGLETAMRTKSTMSIDRTLSTNVARSSSHFQSDEAIAEMYRSPSAQSDIASTVKDSKAKFAEAKQALGVFYEEDGND